MSEKDAAAPIVAYITEFVALNKNYCHYPLFAPPSRELSVEGLEILEYDNSGDLVGYKIKRIYGVANGIYNENEELEKGCIVGCEKKQIERHREEFPGIKVKFGRGLSSFDRKLLLRFLGQVQYQKKIAKDHGMSEGSIENYKMYFSNAYEIGEYLELKNPSVYTKRILESLCKLAATGAWFVNSYYKYDKTAGKGKGALVKGVCHFNFIDYLSIGSDGSIDIHLSPAWVDSHEGHFITAYFKKDEKLRSEISFNLKNLLEAYSQSYGKGENHKVTVLANPLKRDLIKLCGKLGFSETAISTELRRGIRQSLSEINGLYDKEYSVSFEKNKKNEEIVIFSDNGAVGDGLTDRFADEESTNNRVGFSYSSWQRRKFRKK